MKVLGIDTATATASVALVEDGKLLGEVVHARASDEASAAVKAERPNHAEILLPLIERLLHTAGCSLVDLSVLAVSIGPGSFTGLRIGLSTVKGMAYGWKIPVVGVPTLEAVAETVTDWDGLICPFLDARKKEVYAALFGRWAGSLERLREDVVCAPETILKQLRSLADAEPCLFIGDGIRAYGAELKAVLGERARLSSGEGYPSTASAVARLGETKLKSTQGCEPDPVGPLVPLYLRLPEAEVKSGWRGDKS